MLVVSSLGSGSTDDGRKGLVGGHDPSRRATIFSYVRLMSACGVVLGEQEVVFWYDGADVWPQLLLGSP